jgi:hypothetical protein
MPRLFPVCSEFRAGSPSHASRSTLAASSAPLPFGSITTPASATSSSRVIRSSSASPSVSRFLSHVSSEFNRTPNQALQRTPGFGVQLPRAALVRPAQSRAVLPAMKPGTARAFASRRCALMRAPGPESLSLGSLGVFTRLSRSRSHEDSQHERYLTPNYPRPRLSPAYSEFDDLS